MKQDILIKELINRKKYFFALWERIRKYCLPLLVLYILIADEFSSKEEK